MASRSEYSAVGSHFPLSGQSSDGTPLSFNRAPAQDLEPWIGRVMVAMTSTSAETVASGLLCNDASYLRSAMDAHWTVDTRDGEIALANSSFLTGQHEHSMRLSYRGPIRVVGAMLRPGALQALFGLSERQMLQRLVPLAALGEDEDAYNGLYRPDIAPDEWLWAFEDQLRNHIATANARPPSPISQAFEVQAFADPNRPVTEFCEENGIGLRNLQRQIKRDFGLSPKRVLRRARVLDLASRLCGVADEEEVDILLRFFDQSHQIREFHDFFGMTPREFRTNRQGLLTLSLEIRQARRLELLHRIAPGAVRPWMRQPFLPAQASG